jgi:hypothetical protein
MGSANRPGLVPIATSHTLDQFGMRWAPPSAERTVLLVENLLADDDFVLSLDESLRQAIGNEKYLFVSAALLGPDRKVFARVVVAASSRLFFIEPETGQHNEFPWDEVCRFDVSPSPKTNYDTVGLVRYTGTDPIRERIQSGEHLRPDELDALYFCTPRAPTFCRLAKELLSANGVPPMIHRVPPVL